MRCRNTFAHGTIPTLHIGCPERSTPGMVPTRGPPRRSRRVDRRRRHRPARPDRPDMGAGGRHGSSCDGGGGRHGVHPGRCVTTLVARVLAAMARLVDWVQKHRYATPYQDPRWRQIRARILARDHAVCQIRGARCRGTATEADHIIPWLTLDGAWFDEANLRAACKPCNAARVRHVPVDTGVSTEPSRVW